MIVVIVTDFDQNIPDQYLFCKENNWQKDINMVFLIIWEMRILKN